MNSDEVNPAWYCLRSQTKREHIAAASVAKLEGIEVFCPRIRYLKPTRRGKIWWIEPLFPGYLMARFSKADSLRNVLHTQGVSGIVKFGQTIPSLPNEFVESLKQDYTGDLENPQIINIKHSFSPDDEVELVVGAFAGISGKILEIIPAKERVLVLLEFLGSVRPVLVDPFSLILREKVSRL